MGLAAPKKRTLISADPRNNNWANNTETFGQKLLRAHGWAPGDVLGAKDSAHAEYLTEASSTHIKVTFRDDNMGIGAKKNNGDTCTGLNDFQDLLGRLNGKTEVKIEAERQVRESLKRNAYVERKFGTMRFVPGGWLVGDQETKAIEALATVKKDREEDVSSDSGSDSSDSESEEERDPVQAAPAMKKRKADDSEDTQDSDDKKSKKQKATSVGPEGETDKQRRKRERAERRARKELKRAKKAEKEEKKKNKKSKKDKRKKDDTESQDSGDSDTEQKRSKKKRRKEKEAAPTTVVIQATASVSTTPGGSGTSTPTTRFTSRSRFIAQKRAAFADPKALAQILMIKPPTA